VVEDDSVGAKLDQAEAKLEEESTWGLDRYTRTSETSPSASKTAQIADDG
jgi:hypothetical protein